ncbi:MAG: dienelactone hydrolase family protein [Geothrix sp.]|uniref:alpha/beta hydrolase family protein n=1 Tax=Geothrix sp. TaxID=1962974 RepID=UPI0017A8135A|nr:dienelactone hydrolase family protein [Geothrix sp.]NWJ39820.1 dienelactone hydrolase family protein [Geothrix sp.]WIL22167.1 MAG: dienelactone hydrolase family protein [Geothrix sp.]
MRPPPLPITIPGPHGPIPALTLGDCASAKAAVILHYGLSGTMAVQWPEAVHLAGAGYAVLIPEAPHHGLRADGFLDGMAVATASEARSLFLDLVAESAGETRSLVDHLSRSGASRFVVAGISMGGFAALAAPQRDPRVGALLAFLADPHWDDHPESPHLHPDAWERTALLAVVAAGDEVVPPGPMKRFTHDLASRFGSASRFTCLDYQGGHTMDPADWDEAWSKAALWLERHLR